MPRFNHILWILPFGCFILGYLVLSLVVGTESLPAPQLVGQRLNDAVAVLAPYKLTLRILDEVEEPAMPEGTVLSQHPAPGQKIKVYQSIGVVVSRKQKQERAPQLVGKTLEEIRELVAQQGLRIKAYKIESSIYPANQCVSQSPAAGFDVQDKLITVYISSGLSALRLMPDCKGMRLDAVLEFFKTHNIPVTVIPTECDDPSACKVIAQRPPSGSFIDLSHPPTIELKVETV
jgi:serine/threonine-protein kinase